MAGGLNRFLPLSLYGMMAFCMGVGLELGGHNLLLFFSLFVKMILVLLICWIFRYDGVGVDPDEDEMWWYSFWITSYFVQ